MDVTQRGALSAEDRGLLDEALSWTRQADLLYADFRKTCVEMIAKSSFREVERLTGVSTNTLQRWKRETG